MPFQRAAECPISQLLTGGSSAATMRDTHTTKGAVMIVAGLMSGTSCDGIDVAVAELWFEGGGIRMRALGDVEVELPDELQARVRQVMAGEPFPALAFCRLDTEIGQVFATAVIEACKRITGLAFCDIDLICSHGQTLWHWEEQGRTKGTLQMGNPAWIAERTGVTVVSDLRMRDVAAGGNGAPLVGLVDAMLAAGLRLGKERREGQEQGGSRDTLTRNSPEQHRAVGFLNLGGIANITIIEASSALAYDIGPANALIDLAMARYTQGRDHYDKDGRMATRGSVDQALLAELLSHPYYRLPMPRSTGKETFGPDYLDSVLRAAETRRRPSVPLEAEDVVATLTAHAARLVTDTVERYGLERLIVSGGGVANPALREAIVEASPATQILAIDELGLPSGAKEAYAFAVLGFLSVHGLSGTLPNRGGDERAGVVLGNITPGRNFDVIRSVHTPSYIAADILPLTIDPATATGADRLTTRGDA